MTARNSIFNLRKYPIIVVFLAFILTACGGGGAPIALGGGGSGGTGGTAALAVSLLAGSAAGSGNTDGTGAAASFNYPESLTTDSANNIYVADRNNNLIRKITPAGVVTTIAGADGVTGSTDGTGAAASFNNPTGITIDSAGNLYVTDAGTAIRKITPAGVVTTLAGISGMTGSANGTGTAARFSSMSGIAVDSLGNLYVADTYNNSIRKITQADVVTTLAGTTTSGSADGTGSAASFYHPIGIAIDAANNLFVTDSGNKTIREVTPAGVVTTFAGSGAYGDADGTGTSASFYMPYDITIGSAGNFYVTDLSRNTVRKITAAGVVTTLAGTAGVSGSADGTGAAASFYQVTGVTTDSANNIYVADQRNGTIRKITPSGVVTTFSGEVPVVGSADGTGKAASFFSPAGLVTDSAGNVYVADKFNDTIRKITPAGVVTTFAGTAGVVGHADGTGAAASFFYPHAIAVDSADNLYVTEANHDIRKITPAGVVTTLAGSAVTPGSADGTGAAATFKCLEGVAADSAGNVYVAGNCNNTVRKITPAGVVTTLAGTAGVTGGANGTGPAASFDSPSGITVDSVGNVYVTDFSETVRQITQAGVVTTFVGTSGTTGSADGTGAAASFNGLSGLAIDSADNIYLADSGNNTIRKITPARVVTTVVGVVGAVGFRAGNLPGILRNPSYVAIHGSNLYTTDGNGVVVVTNVP